MLQRLAIFFGIMLLLTLAMHSCTPGYYYSVQMTKVNGKPYMLAQYNNPSYDDSGERFFSVYTPKDANWDEWEPIVTDRLGPAFATFAAQPSAQPASPSDKPEEPRKDESPKDTSGEKKTPPPPAERLGIFHDLRATFFDLNAHPPTQTFETLPFNWKGEAAGSHKGIQYVFGVNNSVYESTSHEGPFMVARYDGQKWEELPKVSSPTVHAVTSGSYVVFWMQAVETPNGVTLFWRDLESDMVIAPNLEGYRFVSDGPLMMSTFNGKEFDQPISINGLPRGNFSAWAEGENIKLLIQSRHKTEDALSHNGPMEIWKVGLGGGAEKIEELDNSRNKGGLLAFLSAEHFATDNAEFIVRSNLQLFEIWKKTPESPWTRVSFKPRGLPVYDLESVLVAGVAVAICLIAFGIGLAFHRRKQALTLLRKIRSREIYASLGLRVGAYGVDLGLVLGVTCLLARVQNWSFVSPLQMLDFIQLQYWPFFALYMVYFVIAEWLFGATFGKFIMGLSVVMDGGERISFWSALVRNLVGFFERMPPVFMLVTVWMIVLGPRRQRMGDVLSRSFVVQRGALEAFKTQRAQALALRRANQQDTKDLESEVLPPVDAMWDAEGKADKDGKGRRS